MTILIKLPGVISNTAGLQRVIQTRNGFPEDGLTDLLLFSDGSGTSVTNSITGRAAGTVKDTAAVNNAYAWLSNGGIQLDGTQIVSMPASEASGAWTIVSLGSVTGSVGGTASERIAGILGFEQLTVSPVRGAAIYLRGGNDWNSGTPNLYYSHRAAVAGAIGTPESLLPSTGIYPIGKKFAAVMQYNGSDTITSTIYDKNGIVVASDSMTQSDANMFTASGVTLSALNPCIGLSSSTYAGGRQQVEAFARYSKLLDADEMTRVIAAGIALGAARGRAW